MRKHIIRVGLNVLSFYTSINILFLLVIIALDVIQALEIIMHGIKKGWPIVLPVDLKTLAGNIFPEALKAFKEKDGRMFTVPRHYSITRQEANFYQTSCGYFGWRGMEIIGMELARYVDANVEGSDRPSGAQQSLAIIPYVVNMLIMTDKRLTWSEADDIRMTSRPFGEILHPGSDTNTKTRVHNQARKYVQIISQYLTGNMQYLVDEDIFGFEPDGPSQRDTEMTLQRNKRKPPNGVGDGIVTTTTRECSLGREHNAQVNDKIDCIQVIEEANNVNDGNDNNNSGNSVHSQHQDHNDEPQDGSEQRVGKPQDIAKTTSRDVYQYDDSNDGQQRVELSYNDNSIANDADTIGMNKKAREQNIEHDESVEDEEDMEKSEENDGKNANKRRRRESDEAVDEVENVDVAGGSAKTKGRKQYTDFGGKLKQAKWNGQFYPCWVRPLILNLIS